MSLIYDSVAYLYMQEIHTSTFFLGCAETDPNPKSLSTLLDFIGKQVIACGPPSLGLSAGLCNNICLGNSAGTTIIDRGQVASVRVPQESSSLIYAPSSIPSNLPVLIADIFPTEYCCASRLLNTLSAEEAESSATAVVWCDPVGICVIATALTRYDTVFAIDIVPEHLVEAGRLGVKPLLLTEKLGAAIKAATDGRGADVVLELVGTLDA
jgi:threonine dehydrogenase-like Zn-dependent dehydrogenase